MTRPEKVPARAALHRLLGAVTEIGAPAVTTDRLGWPGYDDLRTVAAATTDVDESVVVADAVVDGTAVVAVAWEFGYLGGSMGPTAGAAIAMAYDRARAARRPVILLTSSGGARMQEGMPSLVQMAATTVAARDHARAGLLQVAILGHPTTGGVFASHANLADVLWAMPGSTIGFAGPRVAEAMTGGPLPEHSHTARGAQAAGLVDDVVAPEALPDRLAQLLAWTQPDDASATTAPEEPHDQLVDAWEAVQGSRSPQRPRAQAWLDGIEVAAELHGDRAGGDDPTVRLVLGRVHGRRTVVIALDRDRRDGAIGPGGFRKVWRGFALAERMGVPVVTLIDTAGADASASAEAGGIASHIARTFAAMLELTVPSVAVVTGEGGSGGALALGVADRLLIAEGATFSVIGVEGAAAILHRDITRAPEVAALLQPDAFTLRRLAIADRVLPEVGVADPVRAGWDAVAAELDHLGTLAGEQRFAARQHRWRTAGH